MNNNDHGFIALGKFSSARDSILHFLCTSDWANESFGDVEAPTGYVWRISNTVDDVSRDNTEFSSVIEDWFTENQEVTDSPALRREIHGHFLVQEDSNGFVHVRQYATHSALLHDFSALQEDFSEWLGTDDDDEA